MSRITAAHIGIEQLSAISLDDQERSLPGRYALLPDGQSIEPHISRLYPERLADRALLEQMHADEQLMQMTLHLLHKV